MASEKLSRGNAATGDEKVHVERERVPKMATHFESLSVPDSAAPGGGVREQRGTLSGPTQSKVDETKEETELLKGENKGFSNEEISGYRQQAQQGSVDALRAAEERFNQAKATAASTLQGVKDTVLEKGALAKDTVLGKGSQEGGNLKATALEKGSHAKDMGGEGVRRTTETAIQKGGEVKDTALEKATQAKDTVLEKGVQAKDALSEGAQKTTQYLGEKGQVAKEGTVSVAGKAKEAVVHVAVEVKDRAAVAGWTAAHYATGLTVEGTKMAADVAKGVAGYAGEKAVAAKDVVASVGQKAAEYTGETVGVVKDKVVQTEESVRDYAARKKDEAKRDLEAKKTGQLKVGTGEQETKGGERSMVEEAVHKPKETVGAFFQGEEQQQSKGHEGGESGGVLQAIGETIVEIAHTTKDLVIGEDEDENQGEKAKMSPQTQKTEQ